MSKRKQSIRKPAQIFYYYFKLGHFYPFFKNCKGWLSNSDEFKFIDAQYFTQNINIVYLQSTTYVKKLEKVLLNL